MTEREALEILKRDDDSMRKGYFCLNDFMALEVAKNALENHIAKKPVGLKKNICPSCSWIVTYKCDSYCPRCGQRILWEEREV